MGILTGRMAIVIGDRDGIPGQAIAECAKSAGAQVIFASTECFVWTAAGAMDLENQKRVKEYAQQYGRDNVIVLLGAAEAEASGLAAETVTLGDPTFAGPLTGVSLGLDVYHVCEDQVKCEFDPEVYDEQVSMMEMVLDLAEIAKEMENIRRQRPAK